MTITSSFKEFHRIFLVEQIASCPAKTKQSEHAEVPYLLLAF